MANLGEIAVQISADISKFNVGIKSALTSIDSFGKKVNEAAGQANNKFGQSMSKLGGILQSNAGRMQEIGGAMTKFVTLPLIGAGLASVKFASDMNETMNKVSVVFGDNAKEVEKWSKTSIEKMGLASQTALDSAALYGDMATSMGFATDDAANMGMGLTQLGADLASFKNIPVGQAMNALSGVFTGETESLKSLGIVMTQANLDAYALSHGFGKTTDKMSQAEQVALRYAYILDKTKNAQGDFARTSGGTANQTRMLWENLKQLGATVGKYLLPAFTYIVKKVNGFLKAMTNMNPILMKIVIGLAIFAAVIPPIIFAIGTITMMMPVFAAGLGVVTGAVSALGAAMLSLLANPVTWIVLAIVGLVAVAWYMWKNWDTVSIQLKMAIESVGYVFKQTWAWIKQLAATYVYGIVSIWGILIGWIPGLDKVFKKLKKSLKSAMDSGQEERNQNKLQHQLKQTTLATQLQDARLKKHKEATDKSKDKTKDLSKENKKLKNHVDDSTRSLKKQVGALASFDKLNLTDISKKISDANSQKDSKIKIPKIEVPETKVGISFDWKKGWEKFKKDMNDAFGFDIIGMIQKRFETMWKGLKQSGKGIGEIFGGGFKVLQGLLEGDWGKATKGMKEFGKGYKDLVEGWLKTNFGIDFNTFKTIGNKIGGSIKDGFGNISNWMFEKFKISKENAKKYVEIGKMMWDSIKSAFGDFKDLFKSIKLPHFKFKNWSVNPIDWVKKMPSIGIDWYATGGVFSQPSVVGLGERGKEAIVPLERNLGWADNVASLLDSRMTGGGSPTINVSVGGQHLGTISSKEISRLNRQAGKTIISL